MKRVLAGIFKGLFLMGFATLSTFGSIAVGVYGLLSVYRNDGFGWFLLIPMCVISILLGFYGIYNVGRDSEGKDEEDESC